MTLELAVKYALDNPIRPIGRNSISRFASVLSDGRNTFVGFNRYKTHPLQKKFGCNSQSIYVHSEIDAIINAIRELKIHRYKAQNENLFDDYSMYVARVLGNGTPASAKPCIGCQRALIHFGIKNIEWTV